MRFVSSPLPASDRRPGVVLLVVMAMLALFAALALSFVFYADAEAIASRLNMDSMVRSQADIDPESLAGYVLSQLLYPTENTNSAMRGWDLARGIYGYDPTALNFTPYNSDGRLPTLGNIDTDFQALGTPVDQADFLNYQIFHDPKALATDATVNFARTPEWFSKFRFTPVAIPPQPSYNVPAKIIPKQYRYVGGANPPWTAYDTNNLVLAQVAADGTVLKPSFYRGWTSSPNTAVGLATTSVNVYKYLSLRPDLTWNFDSNNPSNNVTVTDPRYPAASGKTITTSFSTPDSDTILGPDVKNLEFGPGMLVSIPIGPNTGNAATAGAAQLPKSTTCVITTTLPHGLSKGQTAIVVGVAPPAAGTAPAGYTTGYNGAVTVTSVPSERTFTYAVTAANSPLLPSGGGAVIPQPNQFFNNDSYWMDMGWPVMTAPNGKRYKALVAPLVMCLNNRVNLGVHGNRLGNSGLSSVSNQGQGPSEVNPSQLLSPLPFQAAPSGATVPQSIFAINPAPAGVAEAGGVVTVNTQVPHSFNVGDYVIVAGVANTGYDGAFVVTSVPTAKSFKYTNTVGGLGKSGGGVAYPGDFKLLLDRRYGGVFFGTAAAWAAAPQRFMSNWSYGGVKGTTTSQPVGTAGNFPNNVGSWFNPTDLDGANAGITGSTGISTTPPYVGFATTSTKAIKAAAAAQNMSVASISIGAAGSNNPWTITPGMTLVVGNGVAATTEAVQVVNVNISNTPTIPSSFSAVFTKNHPAGTPATSANMGATLSTKGLNAAKAAQGLPQAMSVATLTGNLPGPPGPSSWTIQRGMSVSVNGVPYTVLGVDPAAGTISASFTAAYPAGSLVTFVPNSTFPNFTPGYTNSVGETVNAPLGFNPVAPGAPNTRPIPSDVESMYRYTGTNGPATLAEIFRIMPNVLSNAAARNKVTMTSTSLDRIGAAPYLNFNRTNPGHYVSGANAYPTAGLVVTGATTKGTVVTVTTQENHNFPAKPLPLETTVVITDPTGTLISVPITIQSVPTATSFTYNNALLSVPYTPVVGSTVVAVPNYAGALPNNSVVTSTAAPWTSDFNTDWRSNLGRLLRVNLNRQLTNYPQPQQVVKGVDFGVILPANYTGTKGSPGYEQAVGDRQQFARDIYNALVQVTGAQDPNIVYPKGTAVTTSPDYLATRWLAQLAVNIVDYIDNDDYVTPFHWYAPQVGVGEWVFGTELPRLLINEVYAQHENGGTNIWTELLNPFNTTPTTSLYPRDGGAALIYNYNTAQSWPVYQLTISNSTLGAGNVPLDTFLKDGVNSLGLLPTIDNITFNPTTVSGTFVLRYGTGAKFVNTAAIPYSANPATLQQSIQTALSTVINAYNGIDHMDTYPSTGQTGVAVTGKAPETFQAIYYTSPGATITLGGSKLIDAKKKLVGGPAITPVSTNNGLSATSAATWAGGTAVNMKVMPSNGSPLGVVGSNIGYYLLGPTASPTTVRNPNFPAATTKAASMTNVQNVNGNISLVLSRLAVPHLPPQTDPTKGQYNPYLTVDYYDNYTPTAASLFPVVNSTNATGGRNQPYAGATGLRSPQANYVTISPAPPAKGVALDPPGAVEIVNKKTKATTFQITTVGAHGFNTGDQVFIWGVAPDTNFNTAPNQLTTITVTGPTTFTYTPTAAGKQANSGGGYVIKAVQNTFFGQNNVAGKNGNTMGSPTQYNWLTHLDRPPINSLELLYVSSLRPHLLTQAFQNKTVYAQQQYAPWNPLYSANSAQQSLIYRALDVLGTPPHLNGTMPGGVLQGPININTLMDPFVFNALCDPQDLYLPGNNQQQSPLFSSADAGLVYNKIIQNRGSSNSPTDPMTDRQPATKDGAPFKAFATGNFASTVLRGDVAVATPTTPAPAGGVFSVPSAAGLDMTRQNALLQKIMNNVTTTSNTYAIWFTVGFFEVVDESVRPPRLGQELGRSQNANIRHRFFAVVDRSGMQLFNTTSTNAIPMNGTATAPVPPYAWSKTEQYFPGDVVVYTNPATNLPGTYQCTTASLGTLPTAAGWNLITMTCGTISPATTAAGTKIAVTPGMLLELDANTANAEVVAVTAVAGNAFQAVFTKPHAAGCTIVCRGNPGPQVNYNPHKDSNVVLHLSVIN